MKDEMNEKIKYKKDLIIMWHILYIIIYISYVISYFKDIESIKFLLYALCWYSICWECHDIIELKKLLDEKDRLAIEY